MKAPGALARVSIESGRCYLVIMKTVYYDYNRLKVLTKGSAEEGFTVYQ